MNHEIDVLKVEDSILENVAVKLNTTLKELDKDVILVQEWLKTQKHLPEMLDQYSLRNFLILNKGSIEVTKHKIDNYYTRRVKMEDFFSEINPKNTYHKQLKDVVYLVLYPGLTEKLHKICYFKVKNENLMIQCEPIDLAKKLFTTQEMRLREDVLLGDIVVADFLGISISTLLKVTPTFLYKVIVLLYEGIFSLRVKAIYLLNTPPYVDIIMGIIKKIVKPKIFNRIHVVNDAESLKKYIAVEMLPKDLGGTGFCLDQLNEGLEAKYAKYQDMFDRLDGIEIDENLRPGELRNDDTDTVYGNFKKLDID